MKPCRKCGAQIFKDAVVCPHCGVPTKKQYGCGTLIAVAFAGFAVLALLAKCSDGGTSTSASQKSRPVAAKPAPVQLSPEEQLARAEKQVAAADTVHDRLAERLNKYYAKKSDIADARAQLATVAAVRRAYEKASSKAEVALLKRATTVHGKIDGLTRKLVASAAEESFVKSGLDITVTATGKQQKTLTIKYVLMSKPMVYKFQNEAGMPKLAREAGFDKIVYTDGYNDTWTVQL